MKKKFDYSVRKCEAMMILPYDDFRYSCNRPACYWMKNGIRSFSLCEKHFEEWKEWGTIGEKEVI